MSVFSEPPPQQSDQPLKLCPFIGNMGQPVMRRPEISQVGGPPQVLSIEPRLFPCQGELCTFWSQSASKCAQLMEAESTVELAATMKRVEKALAPLAKFM